MSALFHAFCVCGHDADEHGAPHVGYCGYDWCGCRAFDPVDQDDALGHGHALTHPHRQADTEGDPFERILTVIQTRGRTLLPDDDADHLAHQIHRALRADLDIVTGLATMRAPLGEDDVCLHCKVQAPADLDFPDVDEDHTWHPTTCEWRRSREVRAFPEFRN